MSGASCPTFLKKFQEFSPTPAILTSASEIDPTQRPATRPHGLLRIARRPGNRGRRRWRQPTRDGPSVTLQPPPADSGCGDLPTETCGWPCRPRTFARFRSVCGGWVATYLICWNPGEAISNSTAVYWKVAVGGNGELHADGIEPIHADPLEAMRQVFATGRVRHGGLSMSGGKIVEMGTRTLTP